MGNRRSRAAAAAVCALGVSLAGCGNAQAPMIVGEFEAPDWSEASAVLAERADFDRFRENIRVLSDMGDRAQGSASYDTAEVWLAQELVSLGYQVEYHDYEYEGAPRRSTYATLVGADLPGEMYLVTAHLDGQGEGGAADDDASGVSLVLEVARVLAGPDVETARSVRFVLWNNAETAQAGSAAYVAERAALQGVEDPPGSGVFLEPAWLGVIHHDMILFDHGIPPELFQSSNADLDVEYQVESVQGEASRDLARLLAAGSVAFRDLHPAVVGFDMADTDSRSFMDLVPSVSVRENPYRFQIVPGSNPFWRTEEDVFEAYDLDDYRLGFDAVRITLGTVAHLSGARITP